ncbi:hypothetical protein BKA64DRAFT_651414 [Cadophora sp. MPI-SDFR-AT-0126]|nr:hypothetical protein BKA64DRAFT_651414 [Leotiomycetes sp. MPI-SDFR-AT-0126]
MTLCPSKDSRATLLGIPQELRDKILAMLIPCLKPAPTHQGDPDSREYLNDTPSIHQTLVKYLTTIPVPDGIPTLKVNKQLRDETLALMQHLKLPSARSYRLDVMLIDGEELMPTWLYVPCLTTRVEELVANLRDLGPFSHRYGRGFRGGDGGPPWMVWCFHSLLIRFLEAGPLGRQENRIDRGVSVQSVVLDIKTPAVQPGMIATVENSTPGRLRRMNRETGPKIFMHPMFILGFVRRWINFISGSRSYGGELIHTRVGILKLMLDGVLVEEYDVSEWLADMPNSAWKVHAYAIRERSGLKTVPSKD